MYRVKRPGVIIGILAIIGFVGVYFVNTNKAIKKGYNVNLIGSTYVSTDQEFSYEFIDETNIKKYTIDNYYNFYYTYIDGIIVINEFDEVLEAIALKGGRELYVITTNIYMIKA